MGPGPLGPGKGDWGGFFGIIWVASMGPGPLGPGKEPDKDRIVMAIKFAKTCENRKV